MRCRGRSISTRAHRNNTMVAKPSSKKSWQHQLITKHLAANAGCVSGWWVQPEPELPEPPGDYLKPLAAWTNWTRCLGVMWQCRVPSLLLGEKKEASLCYGKEMVGIFAQARGRSMSRLFGMDVTHNCSDVTGEVLPCVCLRENLWGFSCWRTTTENLASQQISTRAESLKYDNSDLTGSALRPAEM